VVSYSWVEVRCVFSRRLKVSNELDSLIAAGNLFQTVGAKKLKEHLLKLVVLVLLLVQRHDTVVKIHYFCHKRHLNL